MVIFGETVQIDAPIITPGPKEAFDIVDRPFYRKEIQGSEYFHLLMINPFLYFWPLLEVNETSTPPVVNETSTPNSQSNREDESRLTLFDGISNFFSDAFNR